MSSSRPHDEVPRDPSTASHDDAGVIVPPEDWSIPAVSTRPGQQPYDGHAGRASASSYDQGSSGGNEPSDVPALEGLSFTRATEHNSRALVGMALSGVAALLIGAFLAGFNAPLLLTVALGIAGIVMGWRGHLAARNGLATNGRLGIAAVVIGALAILSVVAVYAMVLFALSQVIP